MLRIKNFLRWLAGKKKITNIYYNPKDFVTVQDLWDHIDTRGRSKEAFLIIIDKNNVRCYAKINKEESHLNEAIIVALDQINNGNK
jgi:hypothetical protein